MANIKISPFLIYAFGFLLSCGKTDEKIQTRELESKKDTHFVMGILNIGGAVKDTNTIYFNDLQSIILANCVSEIKDANYLLADDPFICNASWYEHASFTQNIKHLSCSQIFYSCVGHKFLELAELEGQTVIEGRGVKVSDTKVPFAEDNHFDLYLQYRGSEIGYRYDYFSADKGSCVPEPCQYQITLGPQKGYIRTWLYQAARDAFERAGISGARALQDGGIRPTITNDTSDPLSPDLPPSLAQRFAVEYFEVLERYTETVEKLAKHQAAVGAMDSQWTDATKQQQTLWNAAENSRLAGLKTLLNDNPAIPNGNLARSLQLPACSRKIKGNGIQRAVDFIRAGRAPEVFDEFESPLQIAQATVKWLLWDRDGEFPSNLPAATTAYLSMLRIGIPEVAQAIDILREEKAAFFRVYATTEPVPGNARIVSLMPPTSNLPAAFWQGRLQGMDTPDLQSVGVANHTWFKTIQAVHPHRSAHEFIQYMRDGALQAVNAFGGNYNSEVSKLYGKLLAMGTRHAGDRKLVLWRSGVFPILVYAQLWGRFSSGPTSGVSERVLLIRDRNRSGSDVENAGLWCALEGKIGGVDCSLSDYLESDHNPPVDGDRIAGSPFEQALQVSGESFDGIYHLVLEKNGQRRLLFSFNPVRIPQTFTFLPNPPVVFPIGGTLLDDVSELVDRDPEQCGEPTTHCTGLPMNLVPPLENELTSDSDLYETSWRHYLNLATLAANEADHLGQQLVEEGLQMDMRAEEAARELEAICGGVVNVGDITGDGATLLGAFNSSDASLANCLPSENDTIEMVSIGPALCLWKYGTGEWCECPAGVACPGSCPILKPREGNCGSDLPEGGGAGITFQPILASLGIVNLLDEKEALTTSDVNDVEYVRALRAQYESGEALRPEQWDVLRRLSWMNPQFFAGLVSTVSLNPDPFYHYNVMQGQTVLWSTHKAQNGGTGCPRRTPWRASTEDGENPTIFCEHCDAGAHGTTFGCGSENGAEWVENEFCGSTSAVTERIIWGSRINDILKTASILAGQPGGFAYPRRGSRGDGVSRTFGNANPNTGLPFYSIPVAGPSDYTLDPDGRTCVKYFEGYTIPLECVDPPNVRSMLESQLDKVDYYNGMFTDEFYEGRAILLQANYAIGGSMATCDHFGSLNWFDDTVRHDGLAFSYDVYTKLTKLWDEIDDPEELTVRNVLGNRQRFAGVVLNNDIRPVTCSGDFNLGKLPLSAHNGGGTVNVDLCLDADRLWDALEFAAYFATQMEPSCLDVQDLTETLGEIRSADDLGRVAKYMQCASDEVMRNIQRTVFYNMPKKIVEKMGAGGNGQYAGVQGEQLQAYLEIENALTEFTGALNTIPEITFQMSQQVRATKLNIKGIEIAGKIDDLRRYQNLMSSLISIAHEAKSFWNVKKLVETFGVSQYLSMGIAGLYSGIMIIEQLIGNLQDQATDVNVKIEMNALVTALGTSVSQLRTTLDTLKIKANQVNQALERLNQLRNKAEVLAARATLAGSDAAGRVYPTNTVMRRRYNTTRIRYENALKRAKKLAYIARRAIEFRLGEDLTEMTQDMTLVQAPSAWVEDLCTVTGMDYSAIRVEDEENPMTDYSGQFIGDYVKKLSDVVESYSFDFPFHDSEDVAVISLRDDIKTSVGTCLIESHNHLVYSGDLGYGEELEGGEVFGWKLALDECWSVMDTGGRAENEVCTWVRKDPTSYTDLGDNQTIDASSVATGDWVPTEIVNATIVSDAFEYFDEVEQEWTNRTTGYYAGAVQQTTDVLMTGRWMVSLWYMPMVENHFGHVRVTDLSGNILANPVLLEGTVGIWRKAYLQFALNNPGPVRVEIHASAADGEVGLTGSVAGAVAVWGLQLETLKSEMCDFNDPLDCVTREYQATDARRLVHVSGCVDTTGSSFRQQFRRGCTCLNSKPCTNESSDIRCYWETDFVLNLADIERGEYLTSDAIAVGNYNYRHGSVALNVVGSQILSCPEGGSYQCHANGYLPYTLYHDGEVSIRNHGGWTEDFSMNQARIEHGKALAAEVVVTNPLSSQHQSLLSGFDKKEFRGRPLQGQYTLRIWETPGLQWQNLEDLQLIWRYTYWTAF